MKSKRILLINIFSWLLFYNVFSQGYFYEKQNIGISLLAANNHCLYYASNNNIYKMDYKKDMIDSVYLPKTISMCKFNGNDTLVLIGNINMALDTLSYILIDTNLNILNQTYIPKQSNWEIMALVDFLPFSDKIILLCDIADNGLNSSIIKLSYNGSLLDSAYFIQPDTKSSFAYKLNENEFYCGIETFSSSNLYIDKLDTLLNILWSDTVPIMRISSNLGYINRLNNKFVISESVYSPQDYYYYIGTGIYNQDFDTTYAFNYYTLGNPLNNFDAIIGNMVVSNNHIYSESIYHYGTDTQYIGITCFDTLLNIKWQKKFDDGIKKISTVQMYPAPDGGCIFSMIIGDTATGIIKGALVWLDSTGNKVLSIPQNINVFDNALVYPNPGENELNITVPENNKETMLELYNATGALCKQAIFNTEHQIINTSELPQGIYLYRIAQDGKVISSGKWVKK